LRDRELLESSIKKGEKGRKRSKAKFPKISNIGEMIRYAIGRRAIRNRWEWAAGWGKRAVYFPRNPP